MNRLRPLALACLVSFGALVSVPAAAQVATLCVNCTNEFTTIAQLAEDITQRIQQAEQIVQDYQHMQETIRNGISIDSLPFGDLVSSLNDLKQLRQSAWGMADSLNNFDNVWHMRYRQTYFPRTDYRDEFAKWTKTTLDTAFVAVRQANYDSEQIQDEDHQRISELHWKAMSADGRMQAIQVSAAAAVETSQQLVRLREIMLADLRQKATYQAMVAQQQIQSERAVQEAFNFTHSAESDNVGFVGGTQQ
jgi:P-type conjugative transfer protein TrbJ